MSPVIAVLGASTPRPGDPEYRQGVACGRMLGEAGYEVATGGYGGVMEAVSQGASEAGARVIGITAPAAFPTRPGANRFVTVERPAATITERIHDMLAISAASIALPGSIGTFTELMVAWNLAFVASLDEGPAKPVVAVGSQWRRLLPQVAAAIDTDLGPVTVVDDVRAAVAEVVARVPAG
jgi:uncharacterized protein (TIGR00725 family)